MAPAAGHPPLFKNGVGYDKVWKCIGDRAKDAQAANKKVFEEFGDFLGRWGTPEQIDIGKKMRDKMRENVRKWIQGR